MRRKRRPFTPEQKVSAVRRHLLEGVKVSELCDELEIHPNQYYDWQKAFFENGEAAFSKDKQKEQKASQRQIKDLEDTISHKDSVIAEIISENLELKKRRGER